MIPVPYSVMKDYVAILASCEIPPSHIEYYKKWLRYYYDFSATCLTMTQSKRAIMKEPHPYEPGAQLCEVGKYPCAAIFAESDWNCAVAESWLAV